MYNGKLLQAWIHLIGGDIIIGVQATGCKVRCAYGDAHNAHPQAIERGEERAHEPIALFLIQFRSNKPGRGIGHGRTKTVDLLQSLLLIDVERGEKATRLGAKREERLEGKLIGPIGGGEPGPHLCSRSLHVEEGQEEHHSHDGSESEPEIPMKLSLRLP